ncbi:hypothetical protein [Oricola sp.]|uniref:hypothetical protein n=1 Tax=Oricola sp. TaxID=1979950 RepID=UPI0025EDBD97|nr:hypothetical protein [Oricola sp.]MCI5075660.1 hypothetical protein [Oricola sp.]
MPRYKRARLASAWSAYLQAVAVVARVSGLPMEAIAARRGAGRIGGELAFCRSAAIYLAVCGLDTQQAHLAQALSRPRWPIWNACRSIEARRDDPKFDLLMTSMEKMLGETA